MRRREFLALAAAGALGGTWSFPARGQRLIPLAPGGRPWSIAGLIDVTKAQSDVDTLGPFRMGLTTLGYEEGTDFTIEAHYGNADASLDTAMARELIALNPDVILASSDTQVEAAHQVTTTIPIVGYINQSVTVAEVIGDAAKPTGNVTGIINDAETLTEMQCDLAMEIVPSAQRIGALALANSIDGAATRNAVNAAAIEHRFTPVIADVAQADAAAGFQILAAQHVDAAIVGGGLAVDPSSVVQSAAAAHIPAIYGEKSYVELGGLIGYGFDRKATFARLASFVDILLSGNSVSDTPAQEASSWILALNAKTATLLRLTIPPAVLLRTDELID